MEESMTQEEVLAVKATGASAPTLKLLRNKTHIGPETVALAAKATLTKAAGKVMFNENLKVVITDTGEDAVRSDPNMAPTVMDIFSVYPSDNYSRDAMYYMLAWDRVCKGAGSPGYIKSYELFHAKQSEAYTRLGVPATLGVDPKTKKKIKPELTEQQRAIYNEIMRSVAFSYYEYRLSFKRDGVKAVRSLTYRTIKPLNEDSLVEKLNEQVKILKAKLDIKPKL